MNMRFKLSLLAVLLLPLGIAHAQEGVSPMQPGATTGSHTGALPPPGLYFGYDVDYEWGKLRNGSGDKAGIDLETGNTSMVASLIWSTPYKVLGGNYAMGIAQPYKFGEVTINGQTDRSNGAMSTVLMPAMLSWDLGSGFHLGAGTAVVLRNGKHSYTYNAAEGRYTTDTDNLANRYYTLQPNLALTYFTGDWAFTMNNTVDFNAPNRRTGYRSGNTYYMDLTATRKIGRWTVGALGNWTRQFRDDKVNGVAVPEAIGPNGQISSAGKRAEHIMFGPMVAYDFGKFSVNSRLLASVRSRNEPRMNFWHFGVSVPLQ